MTRSSVRSRSAPPNPPPRAQERILTDPTDQKPDYSDGPEARPESAAAPDPIPESAPNPRHRPLQTGRLHLASTGLWLSLWLLLVATAMVTRPILPVDETRYLAVAWEMWFGGDFIVPHLNGATYDHKPPLLFWLMNLGWGLFGMNEITPRLVAPLFGLLGLYLTQRLAGQLWPAAAEDRAGRLATARTAAVAPLITLGGVFWALFTSMTMFDMMLAALTVWGIGGLVKAWRRGSMAGFLTFGLSIGLGILAKGPAIALHLMPVALAAPLWAPKLTGGKGAWTWKRWYGWVMAMFGLGVVVGLAWAVPAGILGGQEYREAIFWGQSANRVVDADDHARPIWWYLPVLPAMLLPWTLWPRFWKAWGRIAVVRQDGAVRLLLIWFGFAFVVFTLISGKQAHYLLPEIPAIALLVARLLALRESWIEETEPDRTVKRRLIVPATVLAGISGILAILPTVAEIVPIHDDLKHAQGAWMGLAFAFCMLTAAVRPKKLFEEAVLLCMAASITVVCLHFTVKPYLANNFETHPAAQKVRQLNDQGITIGHYGKYHGQLNFAGRLKQPVAVIEPDHHVMQDWARANPEGVIISYIRAIPHDPKPLFTQPYRGRILAFWPASVGLSHPTLITDGLTFTEEDVEEAPEPVPSNQDPLKKP